MMNDDQKGEAIRDVFKDPRKAGRSELLRDHPELVGPGLRGAGLRHWRPR